MLLLLAKFIAAKIFGSDAMDAVSGNAALDGCGCHSVEEDQTNQALIKGLNIKAAYDRLKTNKPKNNVVLGIVPGKLLEEYDKYLEFTDSKNTRDEHLQEIVTLYGNAVIIFVDEHYMLLVSSKMGKSYFYRLEDGR